MHRNAIAVEQVAGEASAGQLPQIVCMDGYLQNRRLSLRWFEPNTCHQQIPRSSAMRRGHIRRGGLPLSAVSRGHYVGFSVAMRITQPA
jgi:hypothetical protein